MTDAPSKASGAGRIALIAWLLASGYYFYQYLLRSAPSVMMPQLSETFGLTTAALAGMLGFFYYGYAPFSLVAGVAMDQIGPRKAMPLGALVVALGVALFATGDPTLGAIGRFLQGAGGVFALIGAAYIATTNFPASRAAGLIGGTQMIGMMGATAGQFFVAPAVTRGLQPQPFWWGLAVAGVVVAVLLFLFVREAPSKAKGGLGQAIAATGQVFRNPQSILCGLVTGLMFIPTTIFDMTWGVRFLQDAHDMPYAMAVMRSASVLFGWIIGCPLLGMLSDRLGRRKPVIIGGAVTLLACLIDILYVPNQGLPPFTLGLVMGVASGAAMLPYTVAKEANPKELSGTATGVVNFIAFSLSALLGPVFGTALMRASGGGELGLPHYQDAFHPLLYGVALAIILSLFLRETGAGARAARAAAQPQTGEAR